MSAPDLVLIEWEDSAQPIPGWQWLADWEDSEVVRCSSVGWLIDDGDVKALAPNVGNIGDEKTAQVSGVIRIPARTIIRVIRLEVQP